MVNDMIVKPDGPNFIKLVKQEKPSFCVMDLRSELLPDSYVHFQN